jgi:ATP-binding cassette subfamily F protein uup
LRQSANLVILDEPTNDLDVATLGALESMLLDYGITALVVTHDRWFLDRVATSILAFEGDGVVRVYPGNYAAFTRLREMQEKPRKSEAPPGPKAKPKTETPKAKLSQKEVRELEALLGEIATLEERQRALESTLADPASYVGGRDLGPERRDLAEVQQRLETSMLRWEELEAKKV